MKIYLSLTILLIIVACSDSKKEAELARQVVLDSVNSANYTNEIRQRTIDSMSALNSAGNPGNDNLGGTNIQVKQPKKSTKSNPGSNETNTQATNSQASNSQPNTAGETSTADNTSADPENTSDDPAGKKKKMSNKTKGALIGAGAGIVTGAVTGAAASKDKTKGAVVGGIIGGAVGSGVGYGVGTNKDKKTSTSTSTTQSEC